MNVLSLFDGMSCGQIAFDKLGVKFDGVKNKYFASEIKPHAIKVTQHNYPNTIQIGDVTKVKAEDLPNIDILIGGSPCQDFSRGNKERLGLEGTKSRLFYEYIRLLRELKPKYFLLENVIMDGIGYETISKELGTYPVRMCGSLVSAAYRDRLYWTNIGDEEFDLFGFRKCIIPKPKDRKITLQSVLDNGYTDKQKHSCLNTNSGADWNQKYLINRNNTTGMITLIYQDSDLNSDSGVRMVNQNELEKLHGIPKGYTSILNKKKAGDLIGDGWTVDVVSHIFSFLPKEYLK